MARFLTMSDRPKPSRLRRFFLWGFAVLLLLLVGAFVFIRVYLPPLMRDQSRQIVRDSFGDSAVLDDVAVSLLGTSITFQGFSIPAPPHFSEPTMVSVAALEVDVGSLRRVAEGEIVIDEIAVERPRVVVETERGGRINLAEVIAHMGGRGGALPPIDINRIRIREGAVVWRDERVSPALTTRLTDLEMDIRGVRSPMRSDEMGTEVRLNALAPTDAPLSLDLTGNFFQPDGAIDFDIVLETTDVDVTHFEPHFNPNSPLVIERGLADARLTGTCHRGRLDMTLVLQMHDFETRIRRGNGLRDRVMGVTPRLAAAFFGSELLDDPITVRIEGDFNDPRFDLTEEMNTRITRAVTDRIGDLAGSGLLAIGDVVETGLDVGGAVIETGVSAVGAVGGLIGDAVEQVPLPIIGGED